MSPWRLPGRRNGAPSNPGVGASGLVWASLPMPGILMTGEDCILEVNPAAEGFLNQSAGALRGLPLQDRLTIEAPLDEVFARVRRDQAPLTLNTVAVGAFERTPVISTLHVAPLGDDPDRLMILISPRDVATRLALAQSTTSSAHAAIGMAEMLAHEIKNPLAGITGAAQLLAMNLTPEDCELTDLIVAESRRIVKLLEQVEQFGNLRPPECRAVNIHDVLDRARRSALLGFASHMRIEEDYDPSLPAISADGDQLQQVFLNLLRNAAQASGGLTGTIRIRTFYDPSLRIRTTAGRINALPLQVEVIDNGPGIPAALRQDIFEPFVSGRENGTGLGLALVSRIILDHGGRIAVESVPGRTVFRISLALAPKQSEDP